MASKPIFLAAHPRACSSAFERVLMTQSDNVTSIHEPLSGAFYIGPERLSDRFDDRPEERIASGMENLTYQKVIDGIWETQGRNPDKRMFIKDMAYFMVPQGDSRAVTAASFSSISKQEDKDAMRANPTVIPIEILRQFHFTFLIRHPRLSIPSYYRCTIPPMSETTGVSQYKSSDTGYRELRQLFDFLRTHGVIGPETAGQRHNDPSNFVYQPQQSNVEICIIDAEDLLQEPEFIVKEYCKSVCIPYTGEQMLHWNSIEALGQAQEAFAKWKGFHDAAIHSTGLKVATKVEPLNPTEQDREWCEKYGLDAAKLIRNLVNENMPHYEYLKQFAIKISTKREGISATAVSVL